MAGAQAEIEPLDSAGPEVESSEAQVTEAQALEAERRDEEDREQRPFLIGASIGMQRGARNTVSDWNPLLGVEVSWNQLGMLDYAVGGVGVFGSARYDHRARGVELSVGPQAFLLMGLVEVGPVVILGNEIEVGVRGGACLTFGYASLCAHVVHGTHGTFFQLSLLGKSVHKLRPWERYRIFESPQP